MGRRIEFVICEVDDYLEFTLKKHIFMETKRLRF